MRKAIFCQSALEVDLRANANLARFAGQRVADATKGGTGEHRGRETEGGMVEKVEELEPQLEIRLLGEIGALEHRHIHVPCAGAGEVVAPGVTQPARTGLP